MSTLTLTDCKFLVGGYNLSGFSNQLDVQYSAEMLDDTVYGTSGTRSSKPGLKKVTANTHVFWDPTVDGALYNRIGFARDVMSWAAVGNAFGDFGYTTRGVNGQYNPLSGEVGQLLSSDFSGEASNAPFVRGQILIPITPALTATGTSTVIQLGALVAPQRLYSALHVIGITGTTPSLVVTIESAALVGFGSPTTRATHATFNNPGPPAVVGADWQEVAAPVTDTFWRAKWTITGATPNFVAYLTVGIL